MILRLRQQLNEQLMSDQLAVDLLSSYLRMDLSAQPWGQPLKPPRRRSLARAFRL
ncbi:nitrilotriacetate monooxygenase [Klebsiella pneumoniae]|nr:nitrilotriacetate monooxygenase [Klebsiella pneumoniae]